MNVLKLIHLFFKYYFLCFVPMFYLYVGKGGRLVTSPLNCTYFNKNILLTYILANRELTLKRNPLHPKHNCITVGTFQWHMNDITILVQSTALPKVSSPSFTVQYGCTYAVPPWTTKAAEHKASNFCPPTAVLRERIYCWAFQHLNSSALSVSLIIHYWSFIFCQSSFLYK